MKSLDLEKYDETYLPKEKDLIYHYPIDDKTLKEIINIQLQFYKEK